MYSAKIFTVKGVNVKYRLRRVQALVLRKGEASQEVNTALQACTTVEELLDFFFTIDFHVDAAFISLFEKRMQELECPV